MTRSSLARGLAVLVWIVLFAASPGAPGQEKGPAGRLPPYYNKVVTDEQRAKIYVIQREYAEKIAALERELAAVKNQLDVDVGNVLTPAQRDQVVQLRIDADQKRAAAKKEKGPGAKKPAKPGGAKKPAA
ncbi:MAG: hypothetical protein WD176_02780 [Pirellulales bacterium]